MVMVMVMVMECLWVSNIRKGKYSPATTTTTPAATATATVSRSGDPPWILKRGGLESSGRIPSS